MSSEPQGNITIASADPPATEKTSATKPFWLRVVGLLLGIAAMGLVVIPAMAFEKPLANPFEKKEEPPKVKPSEPKLEVTKDPMRQFSLAAFGCALIALCVAPVAHVRERHLAMTLSSMSISVGALTWHNLAIGIFAGAAVAAFFIVLAALGQGLS